MPFLPTKTLSGVTPYAVPPVRLPRRRLPARPSPRPSQAAPGQLTRGPLYPVAFLHSPLSACILTLLPESNANLIRGCKDRSLRQPNLQAFHSPQDYV